MRRRDFCVLASAAGLWAKPAEAERQQVPLALPEAVDPNVVMPLLRIFEQKGNFSWKCVTVPFSRALSMVQEGQAVGFGISPSPARNLHLAFSAPIFQGAVWAISRRSDRIDAHSAADLGGRVVCATRMAVYGALMGDATAAGAEPQFVGGDLGQRLHTLLAGRCDLLLVTSAHADVPSLRARLRAAGHDTDSFFIPSRPIVEQGVHFAAARDSELARWIPRIDAVASASREQITRVLRAAKT